MGKLQGKVAIVTGAGRGLGAATTMALAREGASVVLASRTKSELEQVKQAVTQMGQKAQTMIADVSNETDVQRMVQSTVDSHGKIDILVNCAGIYGPIGPMWTLNAKEWMKAIEINLLGTFLCCQRVIPHMIEKKQGKIINFSGGGATASLPRFTAYAVSKTAVVRLTETLADEVKEFNIQVNAIAPGAVDTSLQNEVMAAGEKAGEIYARFKQNRETGKGWVPKELAADLTVFLASKASAGLTGKLIAAPYDGWEKWDEKRIDEVMSNAMFTLRRIDPNTLKPFLKDQP